jgi:O-antigen ligase
MPLFGRAKSKAWYILLFIFGLISMVLSQTRNSEAAFMAAVMLVVVFQKQLRKIVLVGIAVLTPFVAVSVLLSERMWIKAGDLILSFAERDQSSGAIGSLSGRTAWWAYGIEQLSHHPFTGLGAYAAGRFAVLGKLGVGAAAMMHSDWIEVAIGTSFWGLIPFAGALIAAWWLLIKCIRSNAFSPEQRQLGLECLALLCMLTLHSFFNDELSWHCPLLYFMILGYAEFIRQQRKAEPVYAPKARQLWQTQTSTVS